MRHCFKGWGRRQRKSFLMHRTFVRANVSQDKTTQQRSCASGNENQPFSFCLSRMCSTFWTLSTSPWTSCCTAWSMCTSVTPSSTRSAAGRKRTRSSSSPTSPLWSTCPTTRRNPCDWPAVWRHSCDALCYWTQNDVRSHKGANWWQWRGGHCDWSVGWRHSDVTLGVNDVTVRKCTRCCV